MSRLFESPSALTSKIDMERFDWDVASFEFGKPLVWGVYCRVCKGTTPIPGIESLCRIEQDQEFEKEAARHALACQA
jgi:hypothetical protein